MLDFPKLKKILASVFAVYVLFCLAFYFIGGEQIHRSDIKTSDMVIATDSVGELTKDLVVEQPFRIDANHISSVTIMGAVNQRKNTGTLNVSVCNQKGVIATSSIDVSTMQENKPFTVRFNPPATVTAGESLYLRLNAPQAVKGNAVTAYYGKAGEKSKKQKIDESDRIRIDGKTVDGMLCYQVEGYGRIFFGDHFWAFAAAGAVLLLAYGLHMLRQFRKDQPSYGLHVISAFVRYHFLISQLVARDFKTKYKRSVLGVLWSFLNPLLTMVVQYIVFSTLFKADIDNFPVYLLTGIVCFNFFSEATGMSLTSITGNASLITKVYMPKYIYPLTRTMSSAINLLLSLIPLFLAVLVTGERVTPAFLLLIFGIVCLFFLSLGVGMILASGMVFFRDTQFLWNVVSMLWMYMTPIFYPETIVPAKFMPIYKLNPLYHIIRFFRIVLMNGVSPEPRAYLLCAISCLVPLLLGVVIFKRTQDRFVLYV